MQIVKHNQALSTTSYVDMENKPKINGIELSGNITLRQIDVYNRKQIDDMLASSKSIVYSPTKPSAGKVSEGTMYYVGESAPYEIYMYVKTDDGYTEVHVGSTDVPDDLLEKKYTDSATSSEKLVLDSVNDLVDNKLDAESSSLLTNDKTVVGAINELAIMPDSFQDGSDDTLKTNDKTIVGAINELYDRSQGLLPVKEDELISDNTGVYHKNYNYEREVTGSTDIPALTYTKMPCPMLSNGHIVRNFDQKLDIDPYRDILYYHLLCLDIKEQGLAVVQFIDRSSNLTGLSTLFIKRLFIMGHDSPDHALAADVGPDYVYTDGKYLHGIYGDTDIQYGNLWGDVSVHDYCYEIRTKSHVTI